MNTFKIIPNQHTVGLYSINKRGLVLNNKSGLVEPFSERRGTIERNKRRSVAKYIRDTWYPDALFLEVRRIEKDGMYYIVHYEDSTAFVNIPKTDLYINVDFKIIDKDCFQYKVTDNEAGIVRITYKRRTISLVTRFVKIFGVSKYKELERPIKQTMEYGKRKGKPAREMIKMDDTYSISNYGHITRNGYIIDCLMQSKIPMFNHKPVAVLVIKYFKNKLVKYRDIEFKDGDRLNLCIDNLKINKRRA